MPKIDFVRAQQIKSAGGEWLAAKGAQFNWTKPAPDPNESLIQASPGATMVLDARALGLSSGALVPVWQDQSPSGQSPAQTNTSRQPVYQNSGTQHWVRFDGVDDVLSLNSIPIRTLVNAGTPVAIQMAVRSVGTSVADRRIVAEGHTTSTNMALYSPVQTGRTDATVLGHFLRSQNAAHAGDAMLNDPGSIVAFTGQPVVFAVVDTGSAIETWINSVRVRNLPYTPGSIVGNRFAIGALIRNNISANWSGDIFGMVLNPGGFSARTEAALQRLVA